MDYHPDGKRKLLRTPEEGTEYSYTSRSRQKRTRAQDLVLSRLLKAIPDTTLSDRSVSENGLGLSRNFLTDVNAKLPEDLKRPKDQQSQRRKSKTKAKGSEGLEESAEPNPEKVVQGRPSMLLNVPHPPAPVDTVIHLTHIDRFNSFQCSPRALKRTVALV